MWARVTSTTQGRMLGFGPPMLWAVGGTNAYYDVTVGSNGLYDALPGYDFVTGWGTPNVQQLIFQVTGVTPATYVPPPGSPSGTPSPTTSPSPTPSATSTVAITCPAAPQITDAEGDATQAVLVDSGQAQASQPDLDIVSAGVTGTATGADFTITVKDLSQNLGEHFRFDFTVAGTTYELTASRDQSGAESYSWAKPGVAASSLGTLTGSFTGNSVVVHLPNTAFKPVAGGDLSTGTGLSVLAQRYAGVLTATSDDAAPSDPGCTWGV